MVRSATRSALIGDSQEPYGATGFGMITSERASELLVESRNRLRPVPRLEVDPEVPDALEAHHRTRRQRSLERLAQQAARLIDVSPVELDPRQLEQELGTAPGAPVGGTAAWEGCHG